MAFPETRWTLLAKATLSGDGEGAAALNDLCRVYWEPIYQFCSRSGWSPVDSEDLAQRFLIKILEGGLLHRADPERGAFRSFLKTILRRFLADELERKYALKRGGGRIHQSIHDDLEIAEDREVEFAFDRDWARVTMSEALNRTMTICRAKKGKEASDLLGPFLGIEGDVPSYETASGMLGLSLAAFKSEVRQWRLQLRQELRQVVLSTVSAPHEVEEEFSYLRQLLMG